jgi:hypothetical protein
MTLYRNKLSRDDIEYGKVRYHRSHIFARIFLQIRTLTWQIVGCAMLWERCKTMDFQLQPGKFQTILFIELSFRFGKGRVLTPYFSVSNRGSDYKCYVRNNYLITSCYTVRYLPYLPFLTMSNARTHTNGTPSDS